MNKQYIPEIISDCYKSCRTGVLTIKINSILRTIHFDTGNIVFAASNSTGERLADKLLELGAFTQDNLQKAIELSEQYQMRLGQLLVKMNYLPEQQLKEIVQQQVLEIIYKTFSLTDANTEFDYCRPADYDFKFLFSTPQILLEGLRLLDNVNMVQEIIKDLASVLQFVDDPELVSYIVSLQPQETRLISYLKLNTYTTNKLLDSKLFPKEVILKTIAALLLSDILRLGNEKEVEGTKNKSLDTKNIIEFCNQVEEKLKAIKSGVSHHSILEVKPNTSSTDLINAYTQLIKQFHPDRQVSLIEYGLNIREELEIIFNKLTEALQALLENKTSQNSQNITSSSTNNQNTSQSGSNYNEIMEFCYSIENKLSAIKRGASYYQILELDMDSSIESISNSYKRLVTYFSTNKQNELSHYGINMRSEISEITYFMNKAFETLKDPKQRQAYNLLLGKKLVRQTGTHQVVNPNTLPNRETRENTNNFAKTSSTINNNTVNKTPFVENQRNTGSQPSLPNKLLAQNTKPTNSISTTRSVSTGETKKLTETFSSQPITANPITKQPTTNTTASLSSAKPAQPVTQAKYSEPPPANPNFIEQSKQKVNENESAKYHLPKTTRPTSLTDNNRVPTAVDFYVRGTEFYNNHQYDKAIAFLRKAVALSPDSGEYWLELGKSYSKISGQEKQAEAAYLEAIDLSPENADIRVELGLLYQKCGLPENAIEMFQTALDIDPNNTIAKQILASNPQTEGKFFNFLAKIGIFK